MLDLIEPVSRSHSQRRELNRSTRDKLVQEGLRQVQERGWAATGIDAVLRECQVPKGSFYHYFASKEAFGYALLESYQAAFMQRLAHWLVQQPTGNLEPLCAALDGLLDDTVAELQGQGFARNCLLGAMGQELASGHDGFRLQLQSNLQQWEQVLANALFNCSSSYVNHSNKIEDKSKTVGLIELKSQCQDKAQAFWVAWQGAVWHGVLMRNPLALQAVVKQLQAQMMELAVAQRAAGVAMPTKVSKVAKIKQLQPEPAAKPVKAKKTSKIKVVQVTLDF